MEKNQDYRMKVRMNFRNPNIDFRNLNLDIDIRVKTNHILEDILGLLYLKLELTTLVNVYLLRYLVIYPGASNWLV